LPVLDAERQKSASRFCASSRPPRHSPSASITALTAPADVPEIPSMLSRSSLRICSSTPQVKAPCAPPPCSARLIRLVVADVFFSAARAGISEARTFFIADGLFCVQAIVRETAGKLAI
jgi:hypothetical protein